MSLTNMFENKKSPYISFELFPARNEAALKRQEKAIKNLLTLNPDFMSVTFGAGGSTRDGSYELVKKLIGLKGPRIVAYVAAYGLDPQILQGVLNDYHQLGVKTIFCIRGDEPHDLEGFTPHPDRLEHASDLLAFAKRDFSFCTGAAGYPEGHKDASGLDDDLEYVRRKVDNGAEFIISQYFYDNHYFYKFREKCRSRGIDVPILAGIMPIYSVKMTENLARVCGATITGPVRDGFSKIDPDDNAAVAAFGVEFLAKQCRDLLANDVDGLHFYTMNKSKSVEKILSDLRG